jgi:peptidoglycan/xylan/chitin deacetylase (PgdA/CDA1 family)
LPAFIVQLNTLRLAILLCALWACAPTAPAPSPRPPVIAGPEPTAIDGPLRVAVTVDDLPIHGPDTPGVERATIADKLLSAFRRHHLPPVYGFVNGKRVAEHPTSETVLRKWMEAGNPLGNHTYSHVSLNAVSLSEYLADLEKGEEILNQLGVDRISKVFRYPFLMEGNTPEKRNDVRRYLHDHGYVTAEVTIDADDWAFNPPFSRCASRGDTAQIAEMHRTFIDVHVDELRRMRQLGRQLTHREIPQVLLLHIGAADADAIDDLLTAYEREGAHWIDLLTALHDPFFAEDPALPARFGAAFPYLLAKAHGVKAPPPIFSRDLEGKLERVCSMN